MPPRADFSTDGFAGRLRAFYAAYFLYGGIALPFFPLWLASRGLEAGLIGIIVAAPMLVRIVAAPLMAHAADRQRALRGTVILLSFGAAVSTTLIGLMPDGLSILAAVIVAACFVSPLLAITDAYALAGLSRRSVAYGPVRAVGSVSFVVGNLATGLALYGLATEHLIWLIVGALAGTAFAAFRLLPLDREAPVPRLATPEVAAWLDRRVLAVVAASALVQASHAFYYTFSAVGWRAEGLDGFAIGLLWAIGVLAEIALFALSGRLPISVTPLLLLAGGACGAALRWALMALEPAAVALPAIQVLHAASFAATHLGTVGFLAAHAPANRRATAQSLAATASGLAMASATTLAGALYDPSGFAGYVAMAAMALLGLGLVAIVGARR